MASADGDSPPGPHEFGKQFAAAHDRKRAPARLPNLRIRRVHSGSDNQRLGLSDILRCVPDRHTDAERLKPLGYGRCGNVRTGHRATPCLSDFGQPAHADSADSGEMERLWGKKHFLIVLFRLSAAMSMTKSQFLQ